MGIKASGAKFIRKNLLRFLQKIHIELPPWIFETRDRQHLSYYPSGMIYDAVTFVINQKIHGDFLEFGVHTGSSFIQYMKYFTHILKSYESKPNQRLKFGIARLNREHT
ncbi:MAG: hypothetical protein GY730_10205 [bacterium]|nr:hypothetical protein [bacterium]